MRELTVTPQLHHGAADSTRKLQQSLRGPLWVLLTVVLAAGTLLAGDVRAHDKKDEALPPPPLKTRVIAPSAHGPWLLRIDNTGQEPVRLAADIRLLRLTVTSPPVPRKRASTTVCNGPKLFGIKSFPYDRELLLEPGKSYVEQFDPRLFCFGKKAAALVPGALVKVRFGWPDNKRRRGMRAAPFVADAAKRPRKFSPQRELVAPTMLLSHGKPVRFGPKKPNAEAGGDASSPEAAAPQPAKAQPAQAQAPAEQPAAQPARAEVIEPPPEGMPAPEVAPASDRRDAPAGDAKQPVSAEEMSRHEKRKKPPRRSRPDEDALGARLTLTADHYADARKPSDIQLSVQAHNTGDRPLFVALRSRQLSFLVEGPDGLVRCSAQSPGHYIPRDLFRTLHHGKHIHMNVRLMEVCPPHTFDRPGLYRVRPRLHLRHNGQEYGFNALTGVVTVRDPGTPGGTHKLSDDVTLVRVKRGRAPFYRRRAEGIPTRVLAKP